MITSSKVLSIALGAALLVGSVPMQAGDGDKTVATITRSDLTSHPLRCLALTIAAALVYRLESKGPCENVDYDFDSLLRGEDGYKAKFLKALAWVDRYIIGQPYKSKSVKAKDGDLIVSDPQEALGVMGIAQSNIRPVLAGLGFATIINQLLNNNATAFSGDKKLDALAWMALGALIVVPKA